MTIHFPDTSSEATYIHNQGMQAWREGRIDEALNYFNRALDLKEEIGNLSAAASTIHMIGIIHAQKEDWENAARYVIRSLEIDADDRHFDGVAKSLNDISVMLGKRGELEAKSALVELGNLILKHDRRELQLSQKVADRLCAKSPTDFKDGIQQAVRRLMRW